MIVGMINSSILMKLQESLFEFHLTGSRFFTKTCKEETDYDFFTEYNVEIEKFLIKIGFNILPRYNHASLDSNTLYVYRYMDPNVSTMVDVALIKNLSAKIYVNNIIKDDPNLSKLHLEIPKSSRVHLWNYLYEQYREMMEFHP